MFRKSKFLIGAASLFTLAVPITAYAQDADSADVALATPEDTAMASGEKELFAMIAKIFAEDKNAAPIAAAQLALGEKTAAKLLPQGALTKMMNQMFDTIMTPILDALPEMSSSEIMLKTGIYEGEIETLDEEKRKTITALFDPIRKQRGKQAFAAITPFLDETMAALEGPMRTGLSRAYARRFSADQLTKINGFFATPAGSAFAAESYSIQADPEIMRAVFKAMPAMIEKMKVKGPSIEAAMKDLPKERTLSDLNAQEMTTLAGLLKVEVLALEEQRAAMSADASAGAADADVAAIDAAIAAGDAITEDAANPYADETGDEPWYDTANWAKADRSKTDAALKKRDAAENKSSAAHSIWSDAFEKSVAESRDKYLAQGWKPEAAVETEAVTAASDAAAETPK